MICYDDVLVVDYDNVMIVQYDMIEYWFCVNIPPRSLVDLKNAVEQKRIFDQ
jgi:hypothetical protein